MAVSPNHFCSYIRDRAWALAFIKAVSYTPYAMRVSGCGKAEGKRGHDVRGGLARAAKSGKTVEAKTKAAGGALDLSGAK